MSASVATEVPPPRDLVNASTSKGAEQALLEGLVRGSQLAFLRLLEEHAACIRAYVARQLTHTSDIDDVAQDVFIAALKNVTSFRGNSSVRAWLLGIARLRLLDFLRQRARLRMRQGDAFDEQLHARVLARLCDEDQEDRRASRLTALRQCVARLGAMPRYIVERFYFHRASAESLAMEIGRTPSAIRMTLLRSRGVLRRCIESDLSSSEDHHDS